MYRYELDHKESWAPKNWCFWTVVLEKTLESSLDSKEIKPANPKRNQSWIFIGNTDAEAEAPILWSPNVKNWLIGKETLMLGKIEGWRRGQQRMRWLDGIINSMDMNLRKFQDSEAQKAWHAGVYAVPAPGNHHSVFCFYNSHYSRTSYKRNHRILDFLWLVYFTQHNVSKFSHVVAYISTSLFFVTE